MKSPRQIYIGIIAFLGFGLFFWLKQDSQDVSALAFANVQQSIQPAATDNKEEVPMIDSQAVLPVDYNSQTNNNTVAQKTHVAEPQILDSNLNLPEGHPPSGDNSETLHSQQEAPSRFELQIEDLHHYSQDSAKQTKHIDASLAEHGKPVIMDLLPIESAQIGDSVSISFNDSTYESHVSTSTLTDGGNRFLQLDFNEGHMTVFYSNDKIHGKLYTSSDQYIFEHNGEAGFILSLLEYKKINNALAYD